VYFYLLSNTLLSLGLESSLSVYQALKWGTNMEGIPKSDFLKWTEKICVLEEAAVALAPDLDEAPMHESDVDIDVDSIKSIEIDFAQQVDGILESYKLSHLRRPAMTIPNDEPLI